MTRLLNHPKVKPLLSDEHFSVDGTLIEAWVSQKSFRPKDGSDPDGSDFHGHKRKNETHASTRCTPDVLLRAVAVGNDGEQPLTITACHVEAPPPSRLAAARDGSGSPRSATQKARDAAREASDDPEARLRLPGAALG